MLVEIPKNNNSIFSPMWDSIFISFDGGNCHGGKGISNDGTKELILFFGDLFPSLSFVV